MRVANFGFKDIFGQLHFLCIGVRIFEFSVLFFLDTHCFIHSYPPSFSGLLFLAQFLDDPKEILTVGNPN